MRLLVRTTATLGAALLTAAPALHAQFPLGLPGSLTAVTGTFVVNGCAARNTVGYMPSGGLILGIPYCARGSLTIGIGTTAHVDHPVLVGSLSPLEFYDVHPEISRTGSPPYFPGYADSPTLAGKVTNSACPTGCQWTAQAGNLWSWSQQQSFGVLSYDPNSFLNPEVVRITLGYVARTSDGLGFADFNRPEFFGVARSTVPEPSTYALFATGLLGLAAVARRKRKA